MKGSFKVKCIKDYDAGRWLTKDKVYEFVDGHITYDDGLQSSLSYENLDEYKERNYDLGACLELYSGALEIIIRQKGRKVIAIMTEDGEYVKSAKAKCSPEDEFDFNIGAKLAFNRLTGEEVREVKRPAKVGEWIKIVNAHDSFGYYSDGDIFKVLENGDNWSPGAAIVGSTDTFPYIGANEYVVLENYQPEATKALSDYTDKELINELSRRWEDRE